MNALLADFILIVHFAFVLFVTGGNAFYVLDVQTRQARRVFSVTRDVIGPPQITRDGRAIYFTRRVTEADIWLATLR